MFHGVTRGLVVGNLPLEDRKRLIIKLKCFIQAYTGCPGGECARLRENVPYVKVHRYNPKHLYPKLNGYGDNGERKVWSCCGSTYCTC